MTQEKIQAVTEMRFALDTVRASLRGVADEAGKAENIGLDGLATTVQRHRALARDLCDALDHLDSALDEMRVGFEREPGRVRIDVQELAPGPDGPRHAVTVSGGRLAQHSVEALERFMTGEGKLVVLEAEATFDTGHPDGPDDRATIVRDHEGKLRRLPLTSGQNYLAVTVGRAVVDGEPSGKYPAWPTGTVVYVQGNRASAEFMRSMLEGGYSPREVEALGGCIVRFPTVDGAPPGGDRSTYPIDNRETPDLAAVFMRDHATHDDLKAHAAVFYRALGAVYLRTSGEVEVFVEDVAPPSEHGPGCATLRVRPSNDTQEILLHFDGRGVLDDVEVVGRGEPPSLEDVRAVEMPSGKTIAPAAEVAKLARIRAIFADEAWNDDTGIVNAIRDVLGGE